MTVRRTCAIIFTNDTPEDFMNRPHEKKYIQPVIVILYLLIYGILSFRFLELFPFIHSDESWLAGLTLHMAESRDFSVTEPFFNARVRYPHAIKILFHALQILFLKLFGYSPETFRLLSLLAGLFVLFFFYKTAEQLFRNFFFSLGLMVLFSLDIQFIYASHFARQEILVLLALVLCLYIFLSNSASCSIAKSIALGCITGLSVGLHPNSFLIACTMGFCYLAVYLHNHQNILRPALTYVGITGGIASLFIAISYCFDSRFLTHYFTNGSIEFDINAAPGKRLSALFDFFRRLFSGNGGTYYVADIRLQLLLFAGAVLFLFFFYLTMKKEETEFCSNLLCLLFSCLGCITGIFIIGRFSQLSIIFLFPAGWLITGYLLKLFEPAFQKAGLVLLAAALLFISVKEIRPYLHAISYDTYQKQIATYVKPDDKVLGNLNMYFYFENGALLDYRNLPYVMEADGALEQYIEENKIEYIFYTDELTYYFEHRPYYNTLYGNIMFAEALKAYCETACELIGTFENPQYAPRILELLNNSEYGTVSVFRTRYKNSP